jgi:adenylate cyclase
MAESWLVRVYRERLLRAVKECSPPLELGRQDDRKGEGLYQVSQFPDGHHRIAIAPRDDLETARRLAWLEVRAEGRIAVRNQSSSASFSLEGHGLLKPGCECEVDLTLVLACGKWAVRIQSAAPDAETSSVIQSLERPTAPPAGDADERSRLATFDLHATAVRDSEGLIGWLKVMVRVLQSAAWDADYFQQAASAVVELVHLDQGRVLTRDGDGWKTAAVFNRPGGAVPRDETPSLMVVNHVCQQKRPTWFDPLQLPEDFSGFAGVGSAVAAPVLDSSGQVIAILYGERSLESALQAARSVSRLDAMLVEVLAVGISAGLARAAQERAAMALQTQLQQFFTPELARHLMARPELLSGQDLEITVLFCDIRGFSRVSRKHGPKLTLDWTNDVLSTLSDCVLKHLGAVVDYVGDELMAMWGAPDTQADHPERACRAALEMIASLKDLNGRWQEGLGEPTEVGIGINTGIARVGNTGSQRKFKYGPLGDTVNVGSRVQGASKYFKANVLVTKATRDRLGSEFQVRRVGKARVVNIADPIELFELWQPDQPEAVGLVSVYEDALSAFEAGDFRKSARILGRLVNVHPDDGPSIALLARAINCIVEPPESFDAAFRVPK